LVETDDLYDYLEPNW